MTHYMVKLVMIWNRLRYYEVVPKVFEVAEFVVVLAAVETALSFGNV